ncbi:MAG: hypothetical protein ACRENE_19415 [Polyangiaceae bacterium]
MKPSRRRPTRLVPRVVYQTAFVGVIPLCVGCSSSSSTSGGNPDSGDDSSIYNGAVGCAAFTCGVANIGFDSGGQEAASHEGGTEAGASQDDSGDAAQDAPMILAVACAGFSCGGSDAGSSG